MHTMWLAHLDKPRPVVVLTRQEVLEVRAMVTVAPITFTVRGLSSEVAVGQRNDLDHESVANVDLITTISRAALIRPLGALVRDQERELARAIHAAFDLD